MSTLSTTNLKNADSTTNNIVLASDGTTTITSPSNIIKSGTAVASTSGTSIDFTGIPSWVKRVTVMFNGVSTSGTSAITIQLGISSGIVSSGYISNAYNIGTASTTGSSSTAAFALMVAAVAANSYRGHAIFTLTSENIWTASGQVARSSGDAFSTFGGSINLSGTLNRIRITTVNGTDQFDAGSINILYEG